VPVRPASQSPALPVGFPQLGAISTLLEDERGLRCGTERGLWRRAKSWERLGAIQPTVDGRSITVRRLLKATRGDVWAATYSGLYRFRTNGRIDRWTRAQGLAADFITTVSETQDAIWAGTQVELARLRIDPHTGEARIAEHYGRSHGLPGSLTFDVCLWRGGVWAATNQGLARKVLTPNDFADLDTLAERLLDFQYYWEAAAKPFEWKFTRQDLTTLLNKLNTPQ
jgi:ligand-binding sensor domain-containing protein